MVSLRQNFTIILELCLCLTEKCKEGQCGVMGVLPGSPEDAVMCSSGSDTEEGKAEHANTENDLRHSVQINTYF